MRRTRELGIAGATMPSPSPFSPEAVHLSVRCPSCRRLSLTRTYVPKLGSMNGIVVCSRCCYQDQFVNLLALDMSETDPVPQAFTAPNPAIVLRPRSSMPRPSPFVVWLQDLRSHLMFALRSFAQNFRVPQETRPRRLVRAHSTVGP